MRIAFISYEYPPDIPHGGIGTYIRQISSVLQKRGHDIEIFAASSYRDTIHFDSECKVHRIKCQSVEDFNLLVLDRFSTVYEINPFDIIECPEIHAHSLLIQRKYPELPIVIKFHTPVFLQVRLMNFYTTLFVKLRFILGSILRCKLNYFGSYNKNNDKEFIAAIETNNFISPSKSLAHIISKEWGIDLSKIEILPYPFVPTRTYLRHRTDFQSTKYVTFVGKLSVPKGIISFLNVIPQVIKKHPNVFFQIIGPDTFFYQKKIMMSQYVTEKLVGFEKYYKIYGGLDYELTLDLLERADLCVFPSIWENFPNVCLEAMSAGKAIVGSFNGGMSEMLSNGCGILVDPLKESDLVQSISWLLENPEQRIKIGNMARSKIFTDYTENLIGEKTEQIYERIILKKPCPKKHS